MAYELERIIEQINRHVGERVQNLASGITVEWLLGIHEYMDGKKAVGIDGVSKAEYSEGITEKLEDLVTSTAIHLNVYIIAGYNRFNLILASAVVNCQSTPF